MRAQRETNNGKPFKCFQGFEMLYNDNGTKCGEYYYNIQSSYSRTCLKFNRILQKKAGASEKDNLLKCFFFL